MKFLRMILGVGVMGLMACPMGMKAEATNTAPDFKEVYDLIQTHLAGETPQDINRAAVQGLLRQLHSKVSLVAAPSSGTNSPSTGPLLAKWTLYDGPIGYLRVGHVGEGLAAQIATACKELSETNHLKGLILDLRFTDGRDYAEAAAVADLFLSKETPLLDWGNGYVRSKSKSDAITMPVAVIVNRETSAAAEALAAVMRQADRTLILGGNTAGEATVDEEFPLKNGERLRIATSTIKIGNGNVLSANGVVPDIQVDISSEDERAYYADPFKEISKPSNLAASLGVSPTGSNGTSAANGTNHAQRSRPTTEADLIRERKERPGMELEYSVSAEQDAAPEKPVVRDPALGRALDLIKGISVLRAAKPS